MARASSATVYSHVCLCSSVAVILWLSYSMTAADLLPEFALIPSGEFVMGSDDADEDERPAHRVHLDDFLMGAHPITHAEYERFVRETGHRAPAIYELPLVVTADRNAFSRSRPPAVSGKRRSGRRASRTSGSTPSLRATVWIIR